MLTTPKLVLASSSHDSLQLQSMLDGRWGVYLANSRADVLRRLSREHISLVVTDSVLPDGSWRDVVRVVQNGPSPRPRVVVVSRLADESFWMDVLGSGGYNVLRAPFDRADVEWVLDHALSDWLSESQMLGSSNDRETAHAASA